VLIEHDSILESAIVPSPDPMRLTVPKAFILLKSGVAPARATALSIFQHTNARLAPYKRIRKIEFVSELPKTISGKIQRVQLRRMEQQRPAEAAPSAVQFAESDFEELRKS
jgi:acetyl-CoA synthetase